MKLDLSILMAAILPFTSFVCSPKKNVGCISGEIIRITCASTVIRITTTDTLGEDSWKNSMDSLVTSYDNVFKMENKCNLPTNMKAGDIVSFRITAPKQDSCMVCMMYDAPPAVSYSIEFCEKNK